MGKEKGTAQRTKGNTKAASSARSAQVLGENTGFVGFGTAAESGFVPLLQTEDGVPSDFRLAMRKMHKKDVTTKLKALQEFQDLTVSASEAEMLALLPFWPSVYTKLATDTDRRVREQANIALEAVVKGVGKNLAPHLKAMSAVWYIGQSDSHLPAAAAAQAAWKAAFPPHKLAGAVDFCRAEILEMIKENLLTATPQSLSDPKITPAEEMEAKYVRTVAMSLISYTNLLDAVAKLDPDKHKDLLDSPKFWKLSKHKAGNIRKSFFTAVTQLCLKMPEDISNRGDKVAPCVLGNLQDTESGDAMWTCVLQLLSVLPSAWQLVNPHKAVFPGLWKLLSTGADGSIKRVGPYLMPFLSKIPVSVMDDCDKFVDRWFTAMKDGWEIVSKGRSASDTEVVINAYMECTFFVLNCKDFEKNLKQKLIRDNLVPSFEKFDMRDAVMGNLCVYLRFWDRNSSSCNPDIAQLNNLLWSELKYLSLSNDFYNGFLISLGVIMGRKKEEKGPEQQNKPVTELMKIYEAIWSAEMEKLSGENPTKSLETLNKIMINFGKYEEIYKRDQSFEFYKSKVVPLLSNLSLEESVARFTWAVAVNSSEDDALRILDVYVNNTRPSAISLLIQAALDRQSNSLFVKWLSCSAVQDLIVQIAQKLIDNLSSGQAHSNENWKMIKTILNSGVEVPASTQQRLFSTFLQGLQSIKAKENRPTSVRIVEFVCDLLSLLAVSHKDAIGQESGQELIKLVFSFQNLGFNEGTLMKLESCWVTAVRNQPSLSPVLANQIARQLEHPINLDDLDRLATKACALTKVLVKQKNNTLLLEYINSLIPQQESNMSELAWFRIIFDQKQFFESVTDRFESSLIQQAEVEPKNLLSANSTYILLVVLCQAFDVEVPAEMEAKTVLDDERLNLPDIFLDDQRCMELICSIPFVVVYMGNLVKDRNCSPDMVMLNTKLDTAASALFSRLAKKNLDTIEMRLFNGCKEEQTSFQALALKWVLSLTYKYSEWDLRINRFVSLEEQDIDENYNTLVMFMELISQYNIGSGTISSALSLAASKLLSLGGLICPESTTLLWLFTECLSLVRTGSRLHVSGMSEFSGEIQSVLGILPGWRENSEDQMLFNVDLSEHSWAETNKVCTVINFINLVVTKYSELITTEVWDLITCSLVSWVGTMQESKDSLTSRAASVMFGITVSRLAATVGALLGPKGHHPALSAPPPVGGCGVVDPPPKLREEWAEFFSEGIYTILVPLYIQVCAGKERLYSSNLLSSAVGRAIVHCPLYLLLQCELPPLYLIQDVDCAGMPDNITFLLNHFGPLLTSSCRSNQLTAAHIIAALAQEIPKTVDVSGDGEECEIPRRLEEVLRQGELLLSNLLVEYSISDPVGEIPTNTVAFSQTVGYLLAWRTVLRLLESSSDEVRPRYSQYLETRGHISSLLNNVFQLLPASLAQLETAFTPLQLEVDADPHSGQIHQLAASCWTQVCSYLPVYARQWFSKLDRESQGTVEKITCSHVTPVLWTQEVQIINAADTTDNLTLKVRDSVREVVATYSIDEGSMELVVSLPSNYPLGGLNVDSGKRVGVETGQWRKWMLQLTTFLTHQNGSIYEGLNLWKKNVDKRFEGVEECYICFYILHGSNHQLPKLGCRTCKKKFHSACLYKWFSTSNNSSCPLCRNLF